MNFRTQIPDNSIHIQSQLNHDSKIISIGSCFAENMASKFDYFKFENTINPIGILYHSKAIENSITNAVNLKEYKEEDIFFLNERWHSFDAHSELSNESKDNLLTNLNASISSLNQQLNEGTHIVITVGTSWVYRHIESDNIVANCHKVAQKKFLKELLSIEEIVDSLENILALIKSVNPTIKTIFTVSPVRHLKDGFVENTLSKAHLLAAIHEVVDTRNHIHYFPSYEIMTDDLRDYRFYKSDMVHPNEVAIEYIWQQFKKNWIQPGSLKLMDEIDTIQKGLLHRPFNENSLQHQEFLKNLDLKIAQLMKNHNISF